MTGTKPVISGDTIAAIATAPGRSGVAVIRVSGPEAFQVAGKMGAEKPEGGRVKIARLCEPNPSFVRHSASSDRHSPSFVRLQDDPAAFLDEAVVLYFRGPHSYTGEDVVEFQCHGGAVTPRRVLEACFAAGARLARRGEFTERAFLNGRIGYEQAEAVLDLIDAKTGRAADAALDGLTGRKERESRKLYETALDISVRLEHALDIDEGELPEDFVPSVNERLAALRGELRQAIARAHEGHLLREGALVVLAGPPNAGKSSLMNALLETNRAIVSAEPGTTRDTIEEWLDLEGWPIRLADTAGLRETADAVEAEGVRRSRELIDKADVVIAFEDVRTETPTIAIHAKSDLGRGAGLNVSARTGEGIEELKRRIVGELERRAAAWDSGDGAAGQTEGLRAALAALPERCEDLVLCGNAVRAAAERLGERLGAIYSADLLDNLFSRFCVGK